jgi:hypothetical protein
MNTVARSAAALIAIAALAAPLRASADLIDCKAPTNSPYVVFLSEPRFTPQAFASRERLLQFFDRLWDYLDQQRDLEMAEITRATSHLNFRVARCAGRVPAPDGQDFSRAVVRSLYSRNVVIEVWGELDAQRQPGGKNRLTANMNYLITPIRKAADDGSTQVEALHHFRYPDGDIVATDFLDLVANGDLHAYVAAAIGAMAFDGNDFRTAHPLLCGAAARLARVERRLASQSESRAQSQDVRALREYLLALAGKAVGGLQAAPAAGLAGLQSAAQPCGAGVAP